MILVVRTGLQPPLAHRARLTRGHSCSKDTHPSPLLPGLYLRCRGGRHRPGNMAGKEGEGITSGWRAISVAHMFYTRLPSAVSSPHPKKCPLWFPSHFYPQHRAQELGMGSEAEILIPFSPL